MPRIFDFIQRNKLIAEAIVISGIVFVALAVTGVFEPKHACTVGNTFATSASLISGTTLLCFGTLPFLREKLSASRKKIAGR